MKRSDTSELLLACLAKYPPPSFPLGTSLDYWTESSWRLAMSLSVHFGPLSVAEFQTATADEQAFFLAFAAEVLK